MLDQEQSAKLLARLRQQNTPHYTHTHTEAGQRRIFISSSNTLLQLGPGPAVAASTTFTPVKVESPAVDEPVVSALPPAPVPQRRMVVLRKPAELLQGKEQVAGLDPVPGQYEANQWNRFTSDQPQPKQELKRTSYVITPTEIVKKPRLAAAQPASQRRQNPGVRREEQQPVVIRGDINVCYLVRGGPSSFGFFSRKSVGSRKF